MGAMDWAFGVMVMLVTMMVVLAIMMMPIGGCDVTCIGMSGVYRWKQ